MKEFNFSIGFYFRLVEDLWSFELVNIENDEDGFEFALCKFSKV